MKKNLALKFVILSIFLCLFSINSFAGAREKLIDEILEYFGKDLGKYIEDFFRYVGLMGFLAFFKAFSWTKMTLGGFLTLVGVLFSNKKEKHPDKGVVKIKSGKFSFYLKGSLKFALVIAGVILITGAVIDGIKGKNETNKTIKKTSVGYVGIMFKSENDSVVISTVFKNHSAYRAGLKVGDKIIEVNNTKIDKLNIKDVGKFISGTPNTFVQINVQRRDSIFSFLLIREEIK